MVPNMQAISQPLSHEMGISAHYLFPLHSQSNGKAESAVEITENLVKKAKRENKDL